MIIITSSILDGTSSGSRDDAGGSTGSPRDTKSLPGNMYSTNEPKTENSKLKKKKTRFTKKRVYQLGIDIPIVDDDNIIPRKSH